MAAIVRTRRVGAHIDGLQLEHELAVRQLEARRLAVLAGLSEDVISRARAGERISLSSLYRIADALQAVPVRGSLIASLVVKQNGTAVPGQKKTAGALTPPAVREERNAAATSITE